MIKHAFANYFQGITSAKIKLGPVTDLIGHNGAGKTSMAECIEFVLLGEPVRGGVLADVIQDGADGCEAEIVLDDPERTTLGRKRSAAGVTTCLHNNGVISSADFDVLVRAKVGDQAAIRCALRSGGLLSMKPKELQEFLVDLTGARFDAAGIAKALGEEVAAAAARQELSLPKDLEFEPFEDAAVKARIAAKKRHKARQADFDRAPAPAIIPDEDITEAGVKATIAALRAKREQAIRAEAAFEASNAADRESLLESLRTRIAELSPYASQQAPTPKRPAAIVERELTETRRVAAAAESTEQSLKARIAELEPFESQAATVPARPAATVERDLSEARAAATDAESKLVGAQSDASRAATETQALLAKAREEAERDRPLAESMTEGDEALARDLHAREAQQARAEEEKDAAARRLRGSTEDHERCERRLAETPKGGACLAPCDHCSVATAARARAEAEQELKAAAKQMEAHQKSLDAAKRDYDRVFEAVIDASEAADRVAAKAQLDSAEARIATLTDKLAKDRESAEALIAKHTADRDAARAREKALVEELDGAREQERAAGDLARRQSDLASARKQLAGMEPATVARKREQALAAEYDAARQIEREASQVQDRQRDLASAQAQLATLEATPLTQPPEESSESLGKRLSQAEALLGDVRMRDVRLRASEGVEAEAANVRDADKVAKALGPKGAKAKLIADGVRPFLDAANTALELFDAPWRAAIDAVHFGIVAKRGETLFRPEQLSDGHRTRLLYALQFAVARLACIGFIVLDRVELLDDDGRRMLNGLVLKCVLERIQVMRLRHGEPPATVPAGMLAYAVAGTTKRIPERRHDANGEAELPSGKAVEEMSAVRTEAAMN